MSTALLLKQAGRQDTSCSGWGLGPRQQLGEVVVDAGDAKVGFALEGVAQIANASACRRPKTRLGRG